MVTRPSGFPAETPCRDNSSRENTAIAVSEVMRDVDLFVGVASVGNDPNWNDGRPDGRYRTYWESYSW